MAALVDWYRRVTKRRFIRFGVPFLVSEISVQKPSEQIISF